ncbi:MAG TPA: hypothetical protein VGG06_27715 [Thermoanaerobaculia bacterium]
MVEIMGFTPSERRFVPWFFTAVILAMMLGFGLLDFVERNPAPIGSYLLAAEKYESPRSLPEVVQRFREATGAPR